MSTPKLPLTSLFCVLTLMLATVDFAIAQESQSILLLDDFEGEYAFPYNEFNNSIVPPFSQGAGTDIHMQVVSDYSAYCQSGKSLQVTYELLADSNGFCGFESRLSNTDLTNYHYLSFRVKGSAGLEMIQLELVRENGEKSKLSIWDFLACGASKDWQKVVIPLDQFWSLRQRTNIAKLVVIFDQNAAILNGSPLTGEVFFDDFLFGTYFPGYLKLDNFDDRLNTNATGGNNGDFSEDPTTLNDFWSRTECELTEDCSCQLRLHYDTEEDDFGGAFFILGGGTDGWTPADRDISAYDSLRLITWTPSDDLNPGNYKIELKSTTGGGQVHQYRLTGLDTSQQVYAIPFDAFNPPVDPSGIGEFTVVFERNWQFQPVGEVFIDQIELRATGAVVPDYATPQPPVNVQIAGVPVAAMNSLATNSLVDISANINHQDARLESLRLEYQLDCGWVCVQRLFSPFVSSEVEFAIETTELPQQQLMEMRIVAENYNGLESAGPSFLATVGENASEIDAEQLLRDAYALFEFLRYENGVYIDAANLDPEQFHPSSVATTGMGLIALCIADSMGWISDAEDLVVETLTTMNGLRPGFTPERNSCGWFRHFIDQDTGAQAWDSEFSSIDSGILAAGALFCKKYFPENETIADLANCLYLTTDWESMIADPETGGIYLIADEECQGAYPTLPFNEYMIVAWLAKNDYRQSGIAEALWNNHYEDPSVLPTSNFMGVDVLTDGPGRFLSGFVHQFPYFLCHHYTTQPAYLAFHRNAMLADSMWWSKNTSCYDFIWGFGAGSSCVWDPISGYHADDILEHPGTISSPHIIGGFIPIRENGLNDLLRLHNTGLGVYTLPDQDATRVLWRFSSEDPTWEACDVQGVDHSTLLFGGVSHSDFLGTSFFEYFNDFDFPTANDTCMLVGATENLQLPTIGQNFPNPLKDYTVIPFSLQDADAMTIELYDANGRMLLLHRLGYLAAGEHFFQWDRNDSGGNQVPAGLYYYTIRKGTGTSVTKKMVVIE